MSEPSLFLRHTTDRVEEFKPNQRLVELIDHLRPLLEPLQHQVNQRYGTTDIWWSIRPSQYDSLATMAPIAQFAGQVHFTERAIEQGLGSIAPERICQIEYGQLCTSPTEVYEQLRERHRQMVSELPAGFHGQASFPLRQELRLPKPILSEMERAYAQFQNNDTDR